MFLTAFVQTVTAAAPAANGPPEPLTCEAPTATPDDIVVCRRLETESPYRLKAQPSAPQGLPKAEVSISEGAVIAAETEQADVGGQPSNRGMLRLKIKF